MKRQGQRQKAGSASGAVGEDGSVRDRDLDSNTGLRERLGALPLDHFPEGQHSSDRKEDRPSGK